MEDPQMMVEEISIFQNKMTATFPNKVLEQVRSNVVATSGGGSSADQNFGESAAGQSLAGSSIAPGDQAMWRGNDGPTGNSTAMQDVGTFDQREYVKKLEHSIQWLEEKLQRARTDFKTLKKENANLKDSNENHIFINEKLNKALKKSEERIEKLTTKLKTITNESVIIPKSQFNQMQAAQQQQPEPAQRVIVEHGPGSAVMGGGFGAIEEGIGGIGEDDDFFAEIGRAS